MKTILTLVIVVAMLSSVSSAEGWKMQPLQIPTRWATLVNPTNALPEYPRPQLVRRHWQNLNGLWSYTITPKGSEMPSQYDGSILVPYPLESALSGVKKILGADQLLWYRRNVGLRSGKPGERTLLHFGAVDYEATVYVNGKEVGTHTGGYQSFTCDVTSALKTGDNEIVLKVLDPTEAGANPHGKQGMQYTATSGIWQTVWLETVPSTYIESLKLTPDVDRSQLQLQVNLVGDPQSYTVEAIAKNDSSVVAKEVVNGAASLHIDHPHLWSPDDPFLYYLEVRVLKNGKIADSVKSYFGMRKIEVKQDSAGLDRIFLNDQSTYNLGVLDQGFWPDGIYTAPTDAALKFDIQAMKAMGFNTIRKHIKIEPDRWYYYCDKLGMLVWQDMVNPSNGNADSREEFEKETKVNMAQLHNHPSITTWVLFNESFGAPYDQTRLGHWAKQLDPSRLLNTHTGPSDDERMEEWMRRLASSKLMRFLGLSTTDGMDREFLDVMNDLQKADDESDKWVESDMTDVHAYPGPMIPQAEPHKARVLGEYGGTGVFIENHVWNDIPGFGYVQVSADQMTKTYADLADQVKALQAQGLSGSIYTQPTDVESEQNGLMTYDREITKIPLADIVKINSQLSPTPKNYQTATQGLTVAESDLTPEARRYEALLAEYQRGKRDLPFLRHFALMAVRQKDQVHATEAGNEFLAQSQQPYSPETWGFIAAVTRSSNDKGFEILRTQTDRANAMLASVLMTKNAAQTLINGIIDREEIQPFLADKGEARDWAALENRVTAKFGELGRQKVLGAEMLDYLDRQDWSNFGKSYVQYFSSPSPRQYPTNNFSYAVFEHIADPEILQAAIKTESESLQSGSATQAFFGNDPTELDTYANLLYKAGKNQEAIEWEEKALKLSGGHNNEISDHLRKMKAGQPTWP